MAAYTGLYSKLKDKKTAVKDKLKIARFAWKCHTVYIPNKEQVLLDTICGFLVNKKKLGLSEDDEAQIWSCLYWMLRTKSLYTSGNKSILLKPSICQVVIETITDLAVPQKLVHLGSREVIGCCFALLRCPRLDFLFPSKVEYVVGLISSLTKFVLANVVAGQVVSKEAEAVYDRGSQLFHKVVKSHPNIKQILQLTIDHMFVALICLWSEAQRAGPCTQKEPSWRSTVQSLLTVQHQAIFHRDNKVSFNLYLSALYGEGQNQAPKVIDSIFVAMSSVISGKVKMTSAVTSVLTYIPHFFRSFVQAREVSTNGLVHSLFLHLCGIVGVNLSDASSACDQEAMAVTSDLLQVTLDCDLYSVAQDMNAGGVQLQSYKQVLDKVLLMKTHPVKYRCLKQLLLLNHHILEDKMTEVLNCSLLCSTEEMDVCVAAIDDFLCSHLTIYNKLHQVPRWVERALAAIQSLGHTSIIVHFNASLGRPGSFLHRFTDTIGGLPQGNVVEIWSTLLETVCNVYVPQMVRQESACFHSMIDVMRVFMDSVVVLPLSMATRSLSKMEVFVSRTKADVIVPLLECSRTTNDPVALGTTLQLCHSYGGLVMYMQTYSPTSPDAMETAVVMGDPRQGLCRVHGYWSQGHWLHLEGKLRSHYPHLLHLYYALVVQEIRHVLKSLTIGTPREGENEDVRICQDLFSLLLQDSDTEKVPNAVENLENLIGHEAGKWEQVAAILPCMLPFLTSAHVEKIIAFVVQYWSGDQLSPEQGLQQYASCIMVFDAFLDVPEVSTCLLHSVMKHVLSVMDGCPTPGKRKKTSPKKAQSKSLWTEFQFILQSSGQNKPGWSEKIINKKKQKLELSVGEIKSISTKLQLLTLMSPVDYSDSDKKALFLGLSLVLREHCHLVPLSWEPVGTCLKLLCILLSCKDSSVSLDLVDIKSYLSWLVHLLHTVWNDHCLQDVCRLFIEGLCRKIKKDTHSLEAVLQFVMDSKQDLTAMRERRPSHMVVLASLADQVHKLLTRPGSIEEDIKCEDVLSHIGHLCSDCLDLTGKPVDMEPQVIRAFLKTRRLNGLTSDHVTRLLTLAVTSMRDDFPSHDTCLTAMEMFWEILRSVSEGQTPAISGDFMGSIWQCLFASLTKFLAQFQQKSCHLHCVRKRTKTRSPNIPENTPLDCDELGDMLVLRGHFGPDLGGNEGQNNSDSGTNCDACHKIAQSRLSEKNIFKIVSAGAWQTLRQKCLFQANDVCELDWLHVFMLMIQDVMSSYVAVCEIDKFQEILNYTSEKLGVSGVQQDAAGVRAALFVWMLLLQQDMHQEKIDLTLRSLEPMVSSCQQILAFISHMKDAQQYIDAVVVPVLQVESFIIRHKQTLLSPQMAMKLLTGIQLVPLRGQSFCRAFLAACDVLNDVLVAYTLPTLDAIPSFLHCLKLYLTSLVKRCDQSHLIDSEVEDMKSCALVLDRICMVVGSHPAEFNKVAPYVVSDYVSCLQHTTLHPKVKPILVQAMYKLVDICDKFSVAQLHTVLPVGVKQVFSALYDDYNKYYKYKGKV